MLKTQRVPAGAHNEVGTVPLHKLQIVGSRIDTIAQHDLTGFPLSYQFPFGVVVILVPVILGAALVSAILPAETAVRSSLVEALEYE